MARRTNILIDDMAEASETDSFTDEAPGYDHDISDLIDDDQSLIGPMSPEFAARAAANEAMRIRDEAEAVDSRVRRLSLEPRLDRGKSPGRGSTRSRSRSRTRSPTRGSDTNSSFSNPTTEDPTSGKHLRRNNIFFM